jgi:hypothetical protein
MIDVLCEVCPAAVPVIVTGNVPAVAPVVAAKETRLLAPATGFTLKDAVTPVGRPVAARVTAPANPPVRTTPMVLVAVPP